MSTDELLRLSETHETVADEGEDIRGRKVTVSGGETIGKVSDLLVDGGERRVRLIEVASGGFLGIGQDKVFIPVDAITSISDDEVRIDKTHAHVAGAPIYDPALVRERDSYAGLISYYGYGPFWGSDYRYPDYPYYR